MQTFYSIIKIAPNTMTDDSLSIGLLAWDGSKYWLQFSEEKKSGVKRLIHQNSEVVDFAVKQITQQINKLNKDITKGKQELFPLTDLLSSDYFSYLNSYSNGLLRFSKPSFLNETINKENFLKLFVMFIDQNVINDTISKQKSDKKFLTIIKERLINKVSGKIHTEIKIDNKILPSLYFPYEMDCLGMNGVLVGAKSIPFEQSYETIDKNISHYITLISLLSGKYNKDIKKNNFFLIADEPSQIKSHEHKIWESFINNPLFKVIDAEQVETVTDIVESTKASKFLAV